MACPLNRNRFAGSGYWKEDTGSKEMDARLKEMLNAREAQDQGNFKVSTSWSSSTPQVDPSPSNGTTTQAKIEK